LKTPFSLIDLTKRQIPQLVFSPSATRNELLLLVGMLFINVSPTFGQSKDSLIEIVCHSLDPSKYQVLDHTFPFSDEVNEGLTLESILFPIIRNGELISNNLSDFMEEAVDFNVIDDQIKLQTFYPITTNCKLKTFQRYP